jgi:ABC-type phosphate transport system permease subunit
METPLALLLVLSVAAVPSALSLVLWALMETPSALSRVLSALTETRWAVQSAVLLEALSSLLLRAQMAKQVV